MILYNNPVKLNVADVKRCICETVFIAKWKEGGYEMKIAKKAVVVLCAVLMLISPGVVSQQASGELPAALTVKAAEPTYHFISEGDVIINDSEEHIIMGDTLSNKIVIEGGTPTVTVMDLSITLDEGCPLTVHSTDFTLILERNTIFRSGNCAGINVPEGNKITIKENEGVEGALSIESGKKCAGIGGGESESGGTIIIESGTIYAYGGSCAAGIGGGQYGAGGEVIVNGGTVEVTAGSYSAGIGGGYGGDGGKVLVNGGTVTATGGNDGAGIGGGINGAGGDFTINGGDVTVKTGIGGENIGHGSGSGKSGTAAYNGGTVNGVGYRAFTVSYKVDPYYTVEIPASVNLSQGKETTESISVKNVFIKDGQTVNVKLSGANPEPDGTKFHVKAKNNELDYTIRSNNGQVKINENLLSVTREEGNGEAKLTFTAPSEITFAGTYTGTLTFTISVSE